MVHGGCGDPAGAAADSCRGDADRPDRGAGGQPGEGSVVYVNGLATFCFDAGDEVGRRLAAVQLVETEIARPSQVASGFAVTRDTLWRWRCGFAAEGGGGAGAGQTRPDRPDQADR